MLVIYFPWASTATRYSTRLAQWVSRRVLLTSHRRGLHVTSFPFGRASNPVIIRRVHRASSSLGFDFWILYSLATFDSEGCFYWLQLQSPRLRIRSGTRITVSCSSRNGPDHSDPAIFDTVIQSLTHLILTTQPPVTSTLPPSPRLVLSSDPLPLHLHAT
jgi:hypothetical protein